MKTCTKCGETKPLDDFHRNRSRADGRTSWCRECAAEAARRYREENRDKVLERKRQYREENRDKELERQRRYWEENRDKVLERKRQWREANLDEERERDRQRYREERSKRIEYQARYREQNRAHVNSRSLARAMECQALSAELATVPLRTPWTEEEDAFLMADNGMTIFQKAVHLGRRYRSCVGRRKSLRQAVAA